MKKPFLSVTKLSLLTVAGIGFASLLSAQPSLAQSNSVDRGTDQNSDAFARPNSGDLNIMDLIHRANLGSINWNANQTKEGIDSAVAEFKGEQQKAFEELQNSKTDSPEETESR